MRSKSNVVPKPARPRGPIDHPDLRRDCEADGSVQSMPVPANDYLVVSTPRHPATGIAE